LPATAAIPIASPGRVAVPLRRTSRRYPLLPTVVRRDSKGRASSKGRCSARSPWSMGPAPQETAAVVAGGYWRVRNDGERLEAAVRRCRPWRRVVRDVFAAFDQALGTAASWTGRRCWRGWRRRRCTGCWRWAAFRGGGRSDWAEGIGQRRSAGQPFLGPRRRMPAGRGSTCMRGSRSGPPAAP